MKNKKTLLLCSYGLDPAQITLETMNELKTCDAVFSGALEGGREELIRPYCRKLVITGGGRWESAAEKMFEAFKNFDKIAYLVYGNPFFLNPPALRLARKAKSLGIEFRVLAGISSFDAIVNQLGLGNFSAGGLRLINLGDGRRQERKLDAKLDTFFFSLWILGGKHKAFLEEIRAAYGPRHPAFLIDHPRCARTTVGALENALAAARLTTTLYLPAGKP
ncbi:MAG TPA: hypothetical protein DCZ92_13785 [Elusimicrobia bacterium]|nr:hypothetical protein [Elusimicrobiota bacterium]